jgi:hypothetical protein
MTNVEKLDAKLKEMDARIGGLTLGPFYGNAEAVAGEVLRSIEAIENGDFELIDIIGD